MLLVRAKQLLLKGQPGDSFLFWVSDRNFIDDLKKLENQYGFEIHTDSSHNEQYKVSVTLLHQ
jgi:hypothetical protein